MSRAHLFGLIGVAACFVPSAASAIGVLQVDEDHYLTASLGLKLSADESWVAPPANTAFNLDTAVAGFGGQLLPGFRAQLNLTRDPTNHIDVMDAIIQLEPKPWLKLWLGQLLPASDRLTLSGPFFTDNWFSPIAVLYPTGVIAGRDLGATVWGELGGGTFKYQAGAFKGKVVNGTVNPNLEYVGRVVWNVWDPEPGYYNSDSYYGDKRLLSIGVGARHQDAAVGTPGHAAPLQGENIDVLAERSIANAGVATLEGAFYRLDLGGATDPTLQQGASWLGLAGYLFPWKVGPGQLQVTGRYQAVLLDSGSRHRRFDGGLNWIVLGHNAQLDFDLGADEAQGTTSYGVTALLGVQIIL